MASFRRLQSGIFGLSIFGDKDLAALFQQLPDQVQRRAIRPALQKGASVLRMATKREIRARVRKRTGSLIKSLKVRNASKPTKGQIAFEVYFSRSERGGSYAHLVEFGHKIVGRGPDKQKRKTAGLDSTGQRRRRRRSSPASHRGGSVKGRGFFRAAIGKNRGEIRREILVRLQAEVKKQADKQRAKVSRAA